MCSWEIQEGLQVRGLGACNGPVCDRPEGVQFRLLDARLAAGG